MGSLAWRFGFWEYWYLFQVLRSGFASSTCGNFASRLEHGFAEKIGRNYAVVHNSGTTTLHTALEGLGVGYGDEVIIPALTVISCMNVVFYCNAVPVFADIDPDTFLIDPDDIERKITSRTKAIMPVHLYGQVCDMTRIMEIAKKHNLGVVEDCAQCYLGTHKGRIGGTIGDVGSWSFENSKHLTTGDGGIIACDSEELATKIRKLQSQGYKNLKADSGKIRVDKGLFRDPSYQRHDIFGYMYRLNEFGSAVGLAQLKKLEWFVSLRQKMASMYLEVLRGCDWLIPQQVPEGDINSYYTFAMKLVRDDVKWQDFNNKYMEYGGDGIYAAWRLLYSELSINDIKARLTKMGLGDRLGTFDTVCPIAEKIQPVLQQLTTNQHTDAEMNRQAEALRKATLYFS